MMETGVTRVPVTGTCLRVTLGEAERLESKEEELKARLAVD